jgi:hypothetical protein
MSAPPIGEPVDEAQARRTAAGAILLRRRAQAIVTTPGPAPVVADRTAQSRVDPQVQEDGVVHSRLSVQDPVGHKLADQQLEVLEGLLRDPPRAFTHDDPARLAWAIGARVDLVEGSDGWIHRSSRLLFAAAQMCYPEFSARMPSRIEFATAGISDAEEELT